VLVIFSAKLREYLLRARSRLSPAYQVEGERGTLLSRVKAVSCISGRRGEDTCL